MRKYSGYAILAGATLAVGGVAHADNAGSITIDLSGYTVGPALNLGAFIGNAPGNALTVKSVSWNFIYQAGSAVGSASWANELAVELVGPGAAGNPFTTTGFPTAANTGYTYTAGGNPGTVIWGTIPNPWPAGNPFNADINLGWPGSSAGVHNSVGSTNLVNGWAAAGAWTVNILDSYSDLAGGSPAQGLFHTGSFITIHYTVPAPGAAALLGLAGLAGIRRRR